MKNVLEWIYTQKKTDGFDCALGYAWNEHDEGAWLCPTLKTDKDGNVLKNSEGENQRNTGIIDAVKATIKDFRDYEKYHELM